MSPKTKNAHNSEALAKLQTQHLKAHHALDALGAPVEIEGKFLTLPERIAQLAPKLGVDPGLVKRATARFQHAKLL